MLTIYSVLQLKLRKISLITIRSVKKLTVTYFSSDFDKINLDDINKPRKLENYLLYVGNRSNYKNFENLVEAYSKSEKLKKDFKLLIFGGEKSNICGEKLFLEKNYLKIVLNL